MKDDFETLLDKLIAGTRKKLFVWRQGPSGDLYSLSLAKITIRINKRDKIIEMRFVDEAGREFDGMNVATGNFGYLKTSALLELIEATSDSRFAVVIQQVDGYASWANCDLTED